MSSDCIIIQNSPALSGSVTLEGAKNAVLAIMASLILTSGKSVLRNVPASRDVFHMIQLLEDLGAQVAFDRACKVLCVDTSNLARYTVRSEIMKKMRASILVMGPLLARFKRADVALPGGCLIGSRPIDFHLKSFARMGADIRFAGEYVHASAEMLCGQRFVLEYPSVGATENIMMAAVLTPGKTQIINAALEPEVFDLVDVLRKMGASISLDVPATITIEGVDSLLPVDHSIMPDRLEAGTLLVAAAVSGGSITVSDAPAWSMELFLQKLDEIGHHIDVGADGVGVTVCATKSPRAVNFKTTPYPGFPTDLQAPMIAALCCAQGTSVVTETVFENRLLHVRELQKMGAQIEVAGNVAKIHGVEQLYGASVIASDIRASAALIIAGLAAEGRTVVTGIYHVQRGYVDLAGKLRALGGRVSDSVSFVPLDKAHAVQEQL